MDGSARQKLAATGQRQTQQLLATAYQLLEACGSEGTRSAGDGGGCGSSSSAERQQELQEQYSQLAAALRSTLAECRALEAREAEAAAAAPGTSSSAAAPKGDDEATDPEVQQLRARVGELRARLEERNALVKASVDRLRQLLDAMAMWESSKRELAAAAGAAG